MKGLPTIGAPITSVRAPLGIATASDKQGQPAISDGTDTRLSKLVRSSGEDPITERIEDDSVNGDTGVAMNQMTDATVALHQSVEQDFAVGVRAWPETQALRVNANFQQSVKMSDGEGMHSSCWFESGELHRWCLVLRIPEKSAFCSPLSAPSESRHFPSFAFAKPFRAGFFRLATEQPPINVVQSGSVAGAAALFPQPN